MKIGFTDILFRKKTTVLSDSLVGQLLGDISCEALMLAALEMKEEAIFPLSRPLVIAELPPSEDEEE